MIGREISHYRIVEKLGEGGMGVVYKATDTRLDRPVALKFLRADRVADADRRRRFVQEAKAASALNHPNITVVYDVETTDEESFLVMEFIAGRTLQQRIGRRGLPLADAIQYLTQVADALSAAHAAGIIHRDLKPSNIMVGDNGVVKLLDFGLAKLTEPTATVAVATTMTAELGLTGPGLVFGTVSYMSPEQARGEPIDQRADVWAFGCVLYEALTGKSPFGSGSTADIIARILQTEADWTAIPASTPQTVRHLMRACLRQDLPHRLRHIDPAMLGGEAEPSAEAHTARAAPWAVPIGIALVVGGAIGWFASSRSGTTTSDVPPAVVRLSTPFVSPTSTTGFWAAPRIAVAPDGRRLVSVSPSSTGRIQLYLRRMDQLESVALPGTEGGVEPFFSSDGSSIGFFADGRLKKVSLGDGSVQSLCDAAPYGGAWASDNTLVFSGPGFSNGLMRISAFGGTPQPLTTLGPREAVHRWPSLSPSGRVVVYTTSNTTGAGLEEPHIVAESLDTGKRQTLPVEAQYAVFAPSGRHLLLVRNGALLAVAFDPDSLSTTGSPVPIIDGVMQASTGAAQIGVSAPVLAYFQGTAETRRLVWVDRWGRVEPIDAPPRLYVHPRLSPDGQKVAVTITEPKNDIWIYDLTRGTLSRLTVEGSNAYPIWTRDGKRITYVSSQQGHPPNLFWKSADGSGAEERLITSDNTQVSETWAPDGKTLLFVELRPPATGWDILTLSIGSRQAGSFLSTQFADTTPQISPSGRYVAHGSNETGMGELFVHSYPNPSVKVQVTNGGGSQSAWRGDERELYFRAGQSMMVADVITAPTLRIGKPRELFRGPFTNIQGKNYDVTADGQRFLMVRTDDPAPPKEITVVLNWMDDLKSRMSAK